MSIAEGKGHPGRTRVPQAPAQEHISAASGVPKLRDRSLPVIILTPIAVRVDRIIIRFANTRRPMPSNAGLADILGGPSRDTVRRSIQRLILASHISVETKPGWRRIKVLATGVETDWGQFQTWGHAPYSRYARGAERPVKPVRLDYMPTATAAFRFRVQPRRLVSTKPAPVCQFITDEPHPAACNATRACGRVSIKGCSWCHEHAIRVFSALKSKIKP